MPFKKEGIQQYISEAKRYKPLSRSVEKLVIKKAHEGSRAAVRRLVQSNLLFVIKIAFKYQNQGLDVPDLVSAGNFGLIEAAQRIDPKKDNKFITYAVWWIRQSIRHAIFSQARVIRLASNKEEKLRVLYKQGIPIKNYIGGFGPDWRKLMETTGDSVSELMSIIQLAEAPVRLDSLDSDEDKSNLLDLLGSNEENPEFIYQDREKNDHLIKATRQLNDRESMIIHEYFGLGNSACASLAQIGEAIHLSKERVRQIKDEALAKMKTILNHQYSYLTA